LIIKVDIFLMRVVGDIDSAIEPVEGQHLSRVIVLTTWDVDKSDHLFLYSMSFPYKQDYTNIPRITSSNRNH
jgi:hypothetical protein